jgi:asparagine synthase (glutamine-hydrolysing)
VGVGLAGVADGAADQHRQQPEEPDAAARADRADVTGAYEDLLRAVVGGHAYDPAATLIELSGGVDSANTALSLATLPGGHQVTPGAMILDGQRAAQQVTRRRELIRACGFTGTDITVDATARPPLHPAGQRARTGTVSPYDEPYQEAMTALHQAAAAHGIRHVFTGIGGDEMVSVPRPETGALPLGTDRPFMPWITGRTRGAAGDADSGIAPASQVNEMTLIAIGCAAPVILGAGSWPVHPLADPRLVTFGEWLPYEWRERKRLHRERLSRRGLSEYVTRPPIPEVFTGIMDIGLRNHGAELGRRLASHGGHLIDAGYVSAPRLAEACDRISSRTAQQRDREVFDVLALETAIASLTGGPLPGTVAECS